MFDIKITITNPGNLSMAYIDTGQEKINLDKEQIIFTKRFKKIKKSYELFSINSLPIELVEGLKIVDIKCNGYIIENFYKLLKLKMVGNPYVENKVLDNSTNIHFNGSVYLEDTYSQLTWFPFYFSVHAEDYVYQNNLNTCHNEYGCYAGEDVNHNKGYINSPIQYQKDKIYDYGVFGCSMTYGTGLKKDEIWHSYFGIDCVANFGVPGIGVDAIYLNIKKAVKDYNMKKIIILFPNLDRRLMFFQKDGNYFKIPCSFSGGLSIFGNKWISKKEFEARQTEIQKQIFDDKDNQYSKNILKELGMLGDNIFVSSYSKDTYNCLKDYFNPDNILPFFKTTKDNLAKDTLHPGPTDHFNFYQTIKPK